MKRVLWRVVSVVAAVLCAQELDAQYYSWGPDRASLKWSTIENGSATVLYPDTVEYTARRIMSYINEVNGDIDFGFKFPALDIPFVVHAENFVSNGMVMWMPIRVEFLSTPAVDSYSMPWVKQLVSHEYRHTVQYNNLNRSTTKFFSYILGQQGSAASLLFPPLYALEGDATLFETQTSTFGRGLQPSFSMGYRALADELMDEKKYLKWRCGSYTSYVPDHYKMGYQIMSYTFDKYNENILDKVFEYTARNPQFISPYSIALRKFYDTSTKELMYETFGELKAFWESQHAMENSAEVLSRSEEKNFITYSHPMILADGTVLALRSDYRDPSRFVLYDPATKEQRVIAHTGVVSTRPAYAAGRVWWSEYRMSPLFEENVYSQLCYMDLAEGRTRTLKGPKNALYPTPIGESTSHLAYVEYSPTGQYSVVEIVDGERVATIEVTYPNEVHSLAWDNSTERLYIIVTGDSGMWIERQGDDGFEPLTQGAYITLSNLTARDGVLYFGSIASGKDEIHSFDLSSGVERQLSESTYGSFQPTARDGQIYLTTYDKYGYHLSTQSAQSVVGEVEYSKIPANQINPERTKWDVINLDTVTFDMESLSESQEQYKEKKYRKGLHLFDVHSWAPVRFNPLTLLSEMNLDVGLGATLISQNLLSSSEGFLAYGWDRYQGSLVKAGLNYDGLGVDLSLSATYGGEQNIYLAGDVDVDLKRYADATLSASLPLFFNRGYRNRIITPYVGWSYSNGILPTGIDLESQELKGTLFYDDLREGLNKFSVGVSYVEYVQSAVRDLATPFGYALSASYALDPFNSEFSDLYSLYAKFYTPGFAKNNSLTLALGYQDVVGGFQINGYYPLSYITSVLIPHGFTSYDIMNNDYFATSVEYKFPLSYPEISLTKLLYIKRLSLGLGADYAHFKLYENSHQSLSSYGVNFIVDLNAISMSPSSTLTATMSLYKPQDKNLYFQFGLGLPF